MTALSDTQVSALDVDALERSFDVVAPHGAQVVERFYDELFGQAPELRVLFPDPERQRTSLLATLVVLRRSLRDLPALVQALRRLGARHAAYGAQPEHYPLVARLLIGAMAQASGAQWSHLDTVRSNDTLSMVAAEMMAGAAASRSAQDRSPDPRIDADR